MGTVTTERFRGRLRESARNAVSQGFAVPIATCECGAYGVVASGFGVYRCADCHVNSITRDLEDLSPRQARTVNMTQQANDKWLITVGGACGNVSLRVGVVENRVNANDLVNATLARLRAARG